jgi:hypothetical protein
MERKKASDFPQELLTGIYSSRSKGIVDTRQ